MGCIRMTTLRRTRNGDWFARKRIPEDIRKAYETAHGPGHTEERFRLPQACLKRPPCKGSETGMPMSPPASRRFGFGRGAKVSRA
jgi:hypothetical protein